jgi:hypothetical protein
MQMPRARLLLIIAVQLLVPAVWNLAAAPYQRARNPVAGTFYELRRAGGSSPRARDTASTTIGLTS